MLRARSNRLACLLAIVTAVASIAAVGWAKTKTKADGTVHLEVRDLGAGLVGWTWGHGTLTYKGKQYPFKGDGLVVDAGGAEREDASGEVYHLGKVADFEGTYRAVDTPRQGAKARGGEARNDKGVHITLHTVNKGFGATAGPEGVKITLEH